MEKGLAKTIGRIEALKCVAVGVLIAYMIMSILSSDRGFINGLLWIVDFNYKINLLIAVACMVITGSFYGEQAGNKILIEGWNWLLTGVLCGFLTLITSTFLASWTGFFQEGLDNFASGDNPFNDYIIKPLFWVTAFGFIPVLVVGFWLGFLIKSKERRVQNSKTES